MADIESRRAQIKEMKPSQEEYDLMREMNLEAAESARSNKASKLEMDAGSLFSSGDHVAAGDKYMEAYRMTGRPSMVSSAADAYELGGDKTKTFMAIEEYLKHANEDEVPFLYERLRQIQRPAANDHAGRTVDNTGGKTRPA